MFTEYTDCTELMRLISDQKIKPSAIRRYMGKQGVMLTATSASDIAKDIYTIMLGGKEMEQITHLVASEGNYEKSTLINAKMNDTSKSGIDILDCFSDAINRLKAQPFRSFSIDQPIKTTNEELTVSFSYVRNLPGKNRLIDSEKRSVKINIRKRDANNVSIDIRHASSFDAKNALELLDKIVAPIDDSTNDSDVNLSHVNLGILTDKNRVAFFDKLSAHIFNAWRLKTITSITVQRGTWADDENEAEEITDDSDPTGTLAGINQAVLNGSGLRSNSFVQSSLEQGYIISAMKYRYECTKEAGEFIVGISSRSKDLRVDIEKSYCDEDGKLYIQPFPRSQQDEIIQLFQNAANSVFLELCNEQQHALNPI